MRKNYPNQFVKDFLRKHLNTSQFKVLKSTLFIILLTTTDFSLSAQTTAVYTTSGSWTCPQGVTTVQVEAWGGGAGGRNSGGGNGNVGGGGGGGAYARRNAITVVPGTTYNFTVGTGGAGSVSGTNTTATINGVTITAAGGSAGAVSSTGIAIAGGAGGTVAASVGDVRYAGGAGGSGYGTTGPNEGAGGGGGSAAGSTGPGNNGGNATNATTPGIGGATVGNFGGAGGNGGYNSNGTSASVNYGGGGGGAGHKSNSGGFGMNGAMIFTYTCPTNTTNAGPDQNLAACSTTTTLAATAATYGTGTWTVISGTATITSPNSPTSAITGIVPGTPVTLRWTISNGACGTTSDDVIITSPLGPSCLSYCTPTGNLNCTLNDYISNVTINTLNNTSTCGAGGYTNYPASGAQTTTLIKSLSYNFSLSVGAGTGTHGAGVWIDFNQNGVFTDAGEFFLVGNAIAPGTTTTVSIPIPIGANSGNVRMRVRYAYLITVTSAMSCNMTGTYGETEDYTLTLVNPAACSTPTAQPTALSLSPNGNAITGSFTAASPAADNYLVVVSTSSTPPTPVNGTNYAIGSTIGAGYTVADNDNNTTFTATGLTPLTTYYVYVFSFNSACTGGPLYYTASPLNGSTTTLNASYCIPSISGTYQPPTNHHIRKVQFIGTLQDITNTSTYSAVAPFGYQDFTGLATKSIQAQGEGVNVYLEAPNSGYIKAWVDWNKDGDFADAGETVYDSGGISQASTTFGFVIPGAAAIGDYRIRVRISGRNFSGADAGYAWNSCTTNLAYYGETEDYLFTVAQNCNAKIVTVTDGNVCGTGTVTLGATATAGTTQFRWYAAEFGGGALASTATGSWTTPSLSSTTVYWVTAFNGSCESVVRTKVTAKVSPIPTLSFTPTNPEVCGENSIIALTATGDTEIVNLIDETFETGGLGVFANSHLVSNPAVNAQTAWQNMTSTYIPTGLTWYPAISSGFGANHFAFVTSDIGGYSCNPPGSYCYYTIDNALTSPVVNSTSFLDLTLTFKMYYDRYYPDGNNAAAEYMLVEVSTNGGTNWTSVSGNLTADQGYGTRFKEFSYDFTPYINQANLRIRVRYYSNTWANGASIDDIKLFGTKPLNTAFNWTSALPIDAYQDAAATIPYAAGTPAVTVYVKPTLDQLEQGTYTFTASAVLSNGCSASTPITITNKSKVWKGTVDTNWNNPNNWSPVGVPDATSCVIIPSTSIITGSNYNAFAKNLTVKPAGNLNNLSNNTLTVTDWVNVEAGGIFNLENASSLIQINNVANTGNISMKRNVNLRRLDYVYWSSPVANFGLNNVSPGTTGFKWKWTPTIPTNINGFGNWAATSETMTLGKGYIVRGPDAYTTAFQNYTANFTGVPNNGIITLPISRGTYDGANYATGVSSTPATKDDDNWNLIGNPYPSAIDADTFLANNTNIAGFIKLWTHGTLPSAAISDPFYQNFVFNYTVNDYITYNYLGSLSPVFDGRIAAGQGFFVLMNHTSAATTENVTFTNTLRSNAYRNDQFFRNGEGSGENKHRIWLDLIASNNSASRTLMGYADGATNNFDRLYDAPALDVKTTFEVYSLLGNEKFNIQGKGTPFNENDVIPLGIKAPQSGSYTIAIAKADGLFANSSQNIYLEDKLLNVIHNLRVSPYSFATEAGVFDNRFELRYVDRTLSTDDAINLASTVWIYTDQSLNIKSTVENLKEVAVYDVQGKLLVNQKNINNTQLTLNQLSPTFTTLLVKITLENGTVVTKKAIF